MKKNKRVQQEPKIETANEFMDVADIRQGCLYTKSGYVLSYLRVFPYNIALLNERELKNQTKIITSHFKAETKPFSIFVVPRSVDMDQYLDFLEKRYEEEITDINRKQLLNAMIREATLKVTSGTNFEHQFFLKVWESISENAEAKLRERIREFESYYNSYGNKTSLLDDTEILKLCNLFSNGIGSINEIYEEMEYTPISKLKGY